MMRDAFVDELNGFIAQSVNGAQALGHCVDEFGIQLNDPATDDTWEDADAR